MACKRVLKVGEGIVRDFVCESDELKRFDPEYTESLFQNNSIPSESTSDRSCIECTDC
jgi:hypothetical protein